MLADVDKDVVHHHSGGDKLKAGAADKARKGTQGGNYRLAGGFFAEDDFAEESAKHRAEDDAKRAEEKKADEKAGKGTT